MSDGVRGLTIIWEGVQVFGDASASVSRLPVNMGLVQLALGGSLTLFVTGPAIQHLWSASVSRNARGWRLLRRQKWHHLLEEMLDGGARIIACQGAMAARKLSMDTLDPRIEAGGLVSLMQGLGDDRLVVI